MRFPWLEMRLRAETSSLLLRTQRFATVISRCNICDYRNIGLSEKSTERGSLRLAKLDVIILTRKTIILSSDFNDQL